MEIPDNLKQLYRHWDSHTLPLKKSRDIESLFIDPLLFSELKSFIHERMLIWERKVSGKSTPYTNDPILSTYRFCNVFREFDRQTIEFHTLLNPLRSDFPLWLLNMFYCRLTARPETIRAVGLLSFKESENKDLYKKLMNSPRPRYGTPYVFPVSTILNSKTPTRELFITEYLPSVMRDIAAHISTWDKKPVDAGAKEVTSRFLFNTHFLWTEVLIDVAYQFPEYINLFATFPVGPGAKPTIQRISKDDPALVVKELTSIDLNTNTTYNGKLVRLSSENWEGIGCEFRKYTNLKLGKGRKRLFKEK